MTKFLSQALQAPEPFFRLGLQRLEAANGRPAADIRFTTEVRQQTRAQLAALGLDPDDTTPKELYHALQERVKTDDERLTRTLQTLAATHVSAEADVVAGTVHALKQLPNSKRCFSLKSSRLRDIMKKVPPKKAMKQLGYRSLDSFLKHETPTSVLAAALLSEDHHWHKRYLNELKRSRPTDFENRNITIARLDSMRWSRLAERTVAEQKHNLLGLKEAGALLFLPYTLDKVPAGTTTVSLALALHELNEIRAASTFWKLSQVRPDFGEMVKKVAREEPVLASRLIDQHMPWKLIQRYYSQAMKAGEEVFEPHLQLEDMVWHPIEASVQAVEPSMDFWRSSAHLGLTHERGPVSCNLLDVALNYCNRLPFERRIVHYFQQSIWHDLMMRYLHRYTVERAVLHELQPQFAEEVVTA